MLIWIGGSIGYSAGWGVAKLILVLILVLVLAYYTTRFIAKYQGKVMDGKSNIQFIESYRVGNNKMIAIAKIGEQFYALGIGKDEIHVIDKLDSAELKLPEMESDADNNDEKVSFKDVLSQMKKNNRKDDSEK